MAQGFLDLNGTPMLMATGTNSLTVGTNGAASVRFLSNGSERMVLSSGGNLRVGDRVTEKFGLTNITTAGNETYTAAQLATGIITRDPAGGARTDTTDTAAAIIAGTPALSADGDVLITYLINTADAAEAITLAGGTGVTISNVGQTIAQNEAAMLLFRRTSGTTITLYILGA